MHPADGGARGDVEQVGEDRGGQPGGEVGHGGSSSGQCPDADGAEALAGPGRGDGLSWHAAGKQPGAPAVKGNTVSGAPDGCELSNARAAGSEPTRRVGSLSDRSQLPELLRTPGAGPSAGLNSRRTG